MSNELHYCQDYFAYARRKTREIMVGNVGIGGDNPIRVQSMITSDTRDTEACVKQVLDLAAAGCEIVRITAQTKKYAQNLENIRDGVRAAALRRWPSLAGSAPAYLEEHAREWRERNPGLQFQP